MMHVVVAGWTLAQGHSGANRRLLSLLRAIEPLLEPGERVTVLHRKDSLPDDLPTGIRWQPIEIFDRPTWRRVLSERRLLQGALETESATVLEFGTLPVPPRMPCPVSLSVTLGIRSRASLS